MTDAFICGAIRTPIGRYGGALSAVRPDDLPALVLRELKRRGGGTFQAWRAGARRGESGA
jgi:acetyl-CoA acetyltransferase